MGGKKKRGKKGRIKLQSVLVNLKKAIEGEKTNPQ